MGAALAVALGRGPEPDGGVTLSVRSWTADAGRALRRVLRPVRRATIVGPLIEAVQLRAVLRAIGGDIHHVRVAGPEEFAPYLRMLTPISPLRELPLDLAFDYVILRQDHLSASDRRLLAALRDSYTCVLANMRFALFQRGLDARARESQQVQAARQRLAAMLAPRAPASGVRAAAVQDRAILVTTFSRPTALARTLPPLVALGYVVAVVDDGSSDAAAQANRAICDAHGVHLIALPANRGLAAAMNIGFDYLLADRRFAWISYFQDDVEVDPEVMETLRRVEDAKERPIITGYDADEHPSFERQTINGVNVLLKRASPAVHVHAHVDYWRGVLPIPTEYIGAPKRRWEASLEDYWIINNAPGAIARRGLPMICIPNLVRTFLWDAADSTWGNPNTPDPPLASRS